MSTTFYIPSVNLLGTGCLAEAAENIKSSGFQHALIVTDAILNQIGVVKTVADELAKQGVKVAIYDKTQPNPTVDNVNEGLAMLKEQGCDSVISLGGGSPHDCAKGIALLATNGGDIKDYEGVDKSAKPQLPLIAINTTAGTASEMTKFCIITDTARHVKMAIVDKHVTPLMSVNDPELMLNKPAGLTAATGMDALTHAVEAYVSTGATPITDAIALKAIELIQANLRTAVNDGSNLEARDNMATAQFMAGMAFNNAGLGFVHAIAHQLGGYYDLPHGVCNAILLPHVQRFNAAVAAERLSHIGTAMGVDLSAAETVEQGAQLAIQAIVELSADVQIPSGLQALGVKVEDFEILADNALKDACGATNPVSATKQDVIEIISAAM